MRAIYTGLSTSVMETDILFIDGPYTKCRERYAAVTYCLQAVNVSFPSWILNSARQADIIISNGISFQIVGPMYLRSLLPAVRFILGT